MLAESIHASGVTAVVVASVILGTQATRLTNARIRLQVSAVFQTVVFLLESVVFGLIGLQLPALFRGLAGIDVRWPLQALAIAATLMVVRVAWIFPSAALRQRRQGAERSSWRVPAVVSWAGARGVVLLTTAVIVITLVVQGFTLAPLVRRAGIAVAPDDVRQEHTTARLALAHAGLSHLEYLTETAAAANPYSMGCAPSGTTASSESRSIRTRWTWNTPDSVKPPKPGDGATARLGVGDDCPHHSLIVAWSGVLVVIDPVLPAVPS